MHTPRSYPSPLRPMGATGVVHVEFSAKVPRDLFDEFDKLVPIYGSRQWFITAALREFVAQAKKNPTLVRQVEASVQSMLGLNRMLATAGDTNEEANNENH